MEIPMMALANLCRVLTLTANSYSLYRVLTLTAKDEALLKDKSAPDGHSYSLYWVLTLTAKPTPRLS